MYAVVLLFLFLVIVSGQCSIQGNVRTVDATPLQTPVRDDTEQLIWAGRGQEHQIRWTTRDVYIVEKSGTEKPLFLGPLLAMHDKRKRLLERRIGGNRPALSNSLEVTVKSVVGSFVSFEIRYQEVSEWNPVSVLWWVTLDLSKKGPFIPFSAIQIENEVPGQQADLREIFPEDVLLNALLLEPQISRTVSNRSSTPKSIKDLLENNGHYVEKPRIETSDGNFFVTPYSLTHFVFDRIENGRVVVLLPLTSFTIDSVAPVRYIEVLVPIPSQHASLFESSRLQKDGFFGNASMIVSGGKKTKISL